MLSALPAFVVGTAVVRALAHLGVSEVWSFMIVMPLLILAWFYFVGWLTDRWVHKRSQRPNMLQRITSRPLVQARTGKFY